MQNKNPIRFYCKKDTKKLNKVVTKKKPKIGVKQIKGNGDFYFYLYPLGTSFKNFQPTCRPCSPICEL